MKEPETALPWAEIEASHIFYVDKEDGVRYIDSASCKDRDFMVHACNAYPKLVNFLKFCLKSDSFVRDELLKELGEAGVVWESGK